MENAIHNRYDTVRRGDVTCRAALVKRTGDQDLRARE